MPQRKSGQKRLRADKTRRQRNLAIRRKIKEVTKKFLKNLRAKDWEQARKNLHLAYKQLDKAAAKKYIHKNKVSRKKSRLAKKLNVAKKS